MVNRVYPILLPVECINSANDYFLLNDMQQRRRNRIKSRIQEADSNCKVVKEEI